MSLTVRDSWHHDVRMHHLQGVRELQSQLHDLFDFQGPCALYAVMERLAFNQGHSEPGNSAFNT